MSIIEVKNLTKKFGDFTAVSEVSFSIEEGEIFGLLGPNGAGKTTIISILSTILKKTSGEVIINGFNLEQESDIRKSIGIVFQDPSLDDELTGRENLEMHGRLYHMNKDMIKSRMDEVLKLVDLEDKAKNQVKTYSGGMKRRLEIARGLMHHPKILFLDEPTLGLDPQTRRSIWDYIKKLNENEKITIILTTHYMEEADALCNRIGIIDHGKIIALDSPEKLKNSLGGDVVMLETEEAEKLKELVKCESIKQSKIVNSCLMITTTNGEKCIPEIIHIANENNIQIKSVNLEKPTLEDVFLHYTGRTIRDQEGSVLDRMRIRMRH